MAIGSFLALLDDVTSLLDDVALMTKAATKKTVSVLSDDLALNAEVVSGISANRELPIVFAVFKGSLLNKIILIILAILISTYAKWLILPLLTLGGAYLALEGVEKIVDLFQRKKQTNETGKEAQAVSEAEQHALANVNTNDYEHLKIKKAIKTDFILSAEIITLTLSIVESSPFVIKVAVLSLVGLFVSIFIYGVVAVIVRLDDIGLWLMQKKTKATEKIGYGLIQAMPYVLRILSVAGTIAMFLVGGAILAHGLPYVEHVLAPIEAYAEPIKTILTLFAHVVLSFIVGGIILVIVEVIQHMRNKQTKSAE